MVELKECVKCKQKAAYFRQTTNDYHCGQCGEIFKIEEDIEGIEATVKPEEEKSPIEKVEKIMIPEEQAKEEWKKYCELLKERKEKFLKVMKDSFYHAKEGRALINIYDVMRKAGLNEKNEPKLAIARADLNKVIFRKRDTGSGIFEMGEGWNRSFRFDVELTQGIFDIQWPRKDEKSNASWNIKDERITAAVPNVPAQLMPKGSLENYYILWEVDEWKKMPKPKDPFLLKRISQNMFVILGAWDLTELEVAIMEGMKYE